MPLPPFRHTMESAHTERALCHALWLTRQERGGLPLKLIAEAIRTTLDEAEQEAIVRELCQNQRKYPTS